MRDSRWYRRTPRVVLAGGWAPLLLWPLFVGCADGVHPTVPQVAPEAAAVPGQAAELSEDVTYYFGAFNDCGLPATQDAGGDWSFPARGGVGGGSAACLTAQVATPGNSPDDGFVLWQICGDLSTTGRGPKADCAAGAKEWVPRTGETWTQLVDGEHTTASHSTLACEPASSLTWGYRFLYSPSNPDEGGAPGTRITASQPFDLTSDGSVPPPDGCPE